MAQYENLKAAVADVIKQNGVGYITGDRLQTQLFGIINNLGKYATFAGVVQPSGSPVAHDGPTFYLTGKPGTYANFGGAVVKGISALSNQSGSWVATSILDTDIFAKHGYESNPKTLKEVDDDLAQLAGEVSPVIQNALLIKNEIQDGYQNVVNGYVNNMSNWGKIDLIKGHVYFCKRTIILPEGVPTQGATGSIRLTPSNYNIMGVDYTSNTKTLIAEYTGEDAYEQDIVFYGVTGEVTIKEVSILDLTKIFGDNIPTSEEMEKLSEFFTESWYNGETVLKQVDIINWREYFINNSIELLDNKYNELINNLFIKEDELWQI